WSDSEVRIMRELRVRGTRTQYCHSVRVPLFRDRIGYRGISGMGDRGEGSPRFWLRLALVFAGALACAGCFQPLYGEGMGPDRPGIRDALSAIEVKQIEVPANTPEARLSIEIRNNLLF